MSLEDEFEMEREKLIDGEIGVEIPDDIEMRNLDLVIDLALKSYSIQAEDMAFIPPKDRMKAYEIAERYLNQAKDAMAKKEKLRLDREKLEKGTKAVSKPSGEEEKGYEGDNGGVSRKELMERARLAKVK